ncbi:hypothetical protein BRN54_13840 [Xanthomonas oryzae pv. oryzae]|nr:hypothetical protein BRN54_13840 [Xanthomonas oryzae pv. oryzae]
MPRWPSDWLGLSPEASHTARVAGSHRTNGFVFSNTVELDFDNDGVNYSIFQEWTVTPKNYSVGILVETNNKNLSIKGEQSTQIGSLSRLEGKNQISPSND